MTLRSAVFKTAAIPLCEPSIRSIAIYGCMEGNAIHPEIPRPLLPGGLISDFKNLTHSPPGIAGTNEIQVLLFRIGLFVGPSQCRRFHFPKLGHSSVRRSFPHELIGEHRGGFTLLPSHLDAFLSSCRGPLTRRFWSGATLVKNGDCTRTMTLVTQRVDGGYSVVVPPECAECIVVPIRPHCRDLPEVRGVVL